MSYDMVMGHTDAAWSSVVSSLKALCTFFWGSSDLTRFGDVHYFSFLVEPVADC